MKTLICDACGAVADSRHSEIYVSGVEKCMSCQFHPSVHFCSPNCAVLFAISKMDDVRKCYDPKESILAGKIKVFPISRKVPRKKISFEMAFGGTLSSMHDPAEDDAIKDVWKKEIS